MRKAKESVIQEAGLTALPGSGKPRKVVPFSKELALRFIRRAYPGAKILIETTEWYEEKDSLHFKIEVNAPSCFFRAASRVSLQDAFRQLVSSEKFIWDTVS